MFKRNKDKQKDSNAAKANLVKKILGKDSKGPVFGFPCSPDIPARLKMQAGQLQVPMYALAEHALQLSAGLIAKMVESPGECELLRAHLIESHVEARTIEKIGKYDQDMADRLDEERIRRFEIDKAVRQIVVNFIRAGLKPKEIPWLIDFGMRCKLAVAHGEPIPKDWPQDT